ncbi:MAG: DUF434 domain-containing protein [Candidatus Altiarchaeota archaeon]|nr:DUF434 domain-containing protein [Candidatus Altiarchaeota archaeon]
MDGPLDHAVSDMKYLLDRGYRKATVLNLILNRYGLSAEHRNFLSRYVYSAEEIRVHRSRLVPIENIRGRSIVADGYNVLITAETILSGGVIVEGMDGLIRDAAGIHSRHRFTEETREAVREILGILVKHKPAEVLFILDARMSRSGELADYVRTQLSCHDLSGDAVTRKSADHEIKKLKRLTLTSDSAIIRKADEVADVCRELYLNRINP